MLKQFIFVLMCILPVLALYSSSDDVIQLNEKNFDATVLKGSGISIVEFYAPWCGHCKNLVPEWKKAATALKGIVNVVAVDATENPALASKYGVQGYPTIKVFAEDKKKPVDYQQGRDASSIVNFALSQVSSVAKARLGGKKSSESKSKSSGSSGSGKRASEPGDGKSVITLTADNFDELVFNSNKPWMVEFYAPWCGHCKSMASAWASAAEENRDSVNFGAVDATQHEALAQRFGIKGFPTIKYFKVGSTQDKDAKDYNGAREDSAFNEFAARLAAASGSSAVSVEQLVQATRFSEACGPSSRKLCLLAFLPSIYDESAETRNARIATLKEVAVKAAGKPVQLFWLEPGAQPELQNAVGVSMFPALVALSGKNNVFNVYKGAFEPSGIASFINSLTISSAGALPLPSGFDPVAQFKDTDPWDGKDAVLETVEEFDLSELGL